MGLFATPLTIALQAPPSMGFPRQEYWSGLSFPSPGDLPAQGSNPHLLHWQVNSLPLSHLGSPCWRVPSSIFNTCLFSFYSACSKLWKCQRRILALNKLLAEECLQGLGHKARAEMAKVTGRRRNSGWQWLQREWSPTEGRWSVPCLGPLLPAALSGSISSGWLIHSFSIIWIVACFGHHGGREVVHFRCLFCFKKLILLMFLFFFTYR